MIPMSIAIDNVLAAILNDIPYLRVP